MPEAVRQWTEIERQSYAAAAARIALRCAQGVAEADIVIAIRELLDAALNGGEPPVRA